MTTVELSPRADPALAGRLATSAAQSTPHSGTTTADLRAWLDARRQAHRFRVNRIPFTELDVDGWSFDRQTGNLRHRSRRFFTVEGLHVLTSGGPIRQWQQPIINQPEVGILGILAKEFNGVLHLLMQAKMEPGNPNLLQLSPTVQATRSNYTKVHRGADVKYLEYFTQPRRGRVLADVLQSEHGSWFYRKTNRNMLVETTGDVPEDEDFRWLTLGQIGALLRQDNVINMDARTVLACFPVDYTEPGALHSDAEVHSWFTTERSRHDVDVRRIPLNELGDWKHGEFSISRTDQRYFQVVAVSVEASNREVTGWSQPLFEPTGTGIIAFVTRTIAGTPHLLAHARVEAGFLDSVEIGPTVQCIPGSWSSLPVADRPPFLDAVLNAPPERIRYAAVHSEEGGRFLNAESQYLFVEATQAPLDPPPGYCWVTVGQLNSLARHSHYLNVQARSLLACLNSGAARL
ncbi:NDP-hexose 2,3-dehydratase family protein [Streptomyces sp. NPDC002845]